MAIQWTLPSDSPQDWNFPSDKKPLVAYGLSFHVWDKISLPKPLLSITQLPLSPVCPSGKSCFCLNRSWTKQNPLSHPKMVNLCFLDARGIPTMLVIRSMGPPFHRVPKSLPGDRAWGRMEESNLPSHKTSHSFLPFSIAKKINQHAWMQSIRNALNLFSRECLVAMYIEDSHRT